MFFWFRLTNDLIMKIFSIKPTFHAPVAPRAAHEGLAVALARHRPLLRVRPPVADPPIQCPFSATFYYGKVSRDGLF